MNTCIACKKATPEAIPNPADTARVCYPALRCPRCRAVYACLPTETMEPKWFRLMPVLVPERVGALEAVYIAAPEIAPVPSPF